MPSPPDACPVPGIVRLCPLLWMHRDLESVVMLFRVTLKGGTRFVHRRGRFPGRPELHDPQGRRRLREDPDGSTTITCNRGENTGGTGVDAGGRPVRGMKIQPDLAVIL